MKVIYRASLLGISYPEHDSDNARRTWSNVKYVANHPPVEGVNKLTINDLKIAGWRVKRVIDLEPADISEVRSQEWIRWPAQEPKKLGLLKRFYLWLMKA